jgi:REP element-mobilizing transposase RayT
MPVYHFTLHAYRSWRPDHPRGYTKEGKGYLPSDPEEAAAYDRRAKQDPAVFDRHVQRILIRVAHDICTRRNWRLHGVGTEEGHVHLALSWHGFIKWSDVMRTLKNVLSYILGTEVGPRGRRWFVRNGSRKRVQNRKHLDYLLNTYFPDHPGLFWREGMELP